MKDQKNMYPIKTRREKSRRIIYKFSYKMGVLNEKRCKTVEKFKKGIRACIIISIIFSGAYLLAWMMEYQTIHTCTLPCNSQKVYGSYIGFYKEVNRFETIKPKYNYKTEHPYNLIYVIVSTQDKAFQNTTTVACVSAPTLYNILTNTSTSIELNYHHSTMPKRPKFADNYTFNQIKTNQQNALDWKRRFITSSIISLQFIIVDLVLACVVMFTSLRYKKTYLKLENQPSAPQQYVDLEAPTSNDIIIVSTIHYV